MDGLLQFFTNGKSIGLDIYYLMRNPRNQDPLNEKIQQFFNSVPLFGQSVPNRNPMLNKLQHVIDFTEYFTRHAAKALFIFTVVNTVVYHFTRLLTFIALIYFIMTFIFCMIYLDTWEIAGASQDIKDILDVNVPIKRIDINRFVKQDKMQEFHKFQSASTTLNTVNLTIKKLHSLSKRLFFTRPLIRFPLTQILKHLEQLQDTLNRQLKPPREQ